MSVSFLYTSGHPARPIRKPYIRRTNNDAGFIHKTLSNLPSEPLHKNKSLQSLQKQLTQSNRLWTVIKQIDFSSPPFDSPIIIQEILGLASVLRENIELTVKLTNKPDLASSDLENEMIIGQIIDYYSLPALHPHQIKFSSTSISQQVSSNNRFQTKNPITNYFDLLSSPDNEFTNMEIDQSQTTLQATLNHQHTGMKWDNDAGISELTEDLFAHMTSSKQQNEINSESDID